MRTSLLVAAAFAFALAGCRKPTEVQVTDESLLDVESVSVTDPTIERGSIDSTALLPREQDMYPGTLTVTSMKSDNGSGIGTRTFARVVFENRMRPIFSSGRKYFYAFFVGNLSLSNGISTELILPHERMIGNVPNGFEYVKELSSYIPHATYSFTSYGSDSVMAFSVSVESPENLTVASPIGGQRIARDRDVNMQWTGHGNLSIIISLKSPQGNLTPLLTLRPRRNEGHVLLTRKILNALPRGSYVLTFVLANKDEHFTVGRFPGRVLVQALSIYNIRVDLI